MNSLPGFFYTKSIRLVPDGFSLYDCGEDGGDGIVRVRHCRYADNELITTTAPAFFRFKDEEPPAVDVIVATRIPVLVPDALYDERKNKDYLRLQYDLTSYGLSFSDTLAQYRAVGFLEQNEKSTFENLGCRTAFHSDAFQLYRFLAAQDTPEAVMLALNGTFADIVAMHRHEPVLVNRLHHTAPTDILYHLLNAIRQFGLSRPDIYVHDFYGPDNKLNGFLKKYLPGTVFL